MGWWDEGVFGGDTPWDFLGDIGEAIGYHNYDVDPIITVVGVESLTDHEKLQVRQLLESNFDKVLELEPKDYEIDVWYQVLGQLIMCVGAKFPSDLRHQVLKSALKDEWANEGDEKRQNHMARLMNDVTFYKEGTMMELTTKGLFESFAEMQKSFIQENC